MSKKSIIIYLFSFIIISNATAQQKSEPFSDIDQTWQNGSDRRDSSVFKNMKYFTPSIFMDVNYTHSFNNPNDNTVVGSTALARNDEMQISSANIV